jgi:pimeloyl-ACP methyl ester carboxylesterase
MPVVDVGSVSLFCTDSEPDAGFGGPALLLIHGWGCDSHDWSFQLDAFEARHRVIAVDLRGHGRSSVPEGDYGAQDYAQDLATLLARLDTGPVVAIGHSLGGSVAAALAVEHPELVQAMVAVEPAYGQDEATVEWMRGASVHFGSEGGNELAAQLQGSTEPNTPAWLKTWHRRRTLGVPPALLAQTFHAMYFAASQFSAQPQSDPYLARRTCPTLAFHRLPAMGAWETGILTHPYSHVVTWEGAGHWLHQERVDEFNALVLAWIAELPAVDRSADLVSPTAADPS